MSNTIAITDRAYDGIIEVVDAVKTDERNLDTDEYAGRIVDAVTPKFLPEPYYDEQRLAWQALPESAVYGLTIFHPTEGGACSFPVTPEQAQHILAYLSEQNRKESE